MSQESERADAAGHHGGAWQPKGDMSAKQPPSLEQQLERLRQDIDRIRDVPARLQQYLSAAKQLEAILAQRDTAIERYTGAWQGLEARRATLQQYGDDAASEVLQVLGRDRVDKLDAQIRRAGAELTDLEAEIAEKSKKLVDLRAHADRADAALKLAERSFEESLSRDRVLDASYKAMEGLRQRIADANAANRRSLMHYRLSALFLPNVRVKVPTPPEFKTQLDSAWKTLADAREAALDAKSRLEGSEADLKAKRTALEKNTKELTSKLETQFSKES